MDAVFHWQAGDTEEVKTLKLFIHRLRRFPQIKKINKIIKIKSVLTWRGDLSGEVLTKTALCNLWLNYSLLQFHPGIKFIKIF